MEEVRIIDLKESILADNDADADKLREELAAEKTVYINVMSSPGSARHPPYSDWWSSSDCSAKWACLRQISTAT